MNRISRALLLALPVALAACGQSESNGPGIAEVGGQVSSTAEVAVLKQSAGEIPSVQAPSIAAARKYATGFDTGNLMSARQVFVFFDPQCPHCGMFWEETKQLSKQARFTWVPVAVLNRTSLNQGAAILTSKSPVDTMNQHEAKFLAKAGGLDAAAPDAVTKATIERNTRLLESFGAQGVPYVLSVNSETGAVVVESRGMPAATLASMLGWSQVGNSAAD